MGNTLAGGGTAGSEVSIINHKNVGTQMLETPFFCRRGINLQHSQGPSFSPSPLPPKTFNSPVPELSGNDLQTLSGNE